ncbi:hypothetical protein HPB50_017720 [Hyalomma asiaticum]|uniref:Uncharacterized protein n=1 Tax=Hyalomma asiaticum TaxID=266040 RepID=A0ACB7SXM6_HYAAI|nr:hypothetical protein HPB50_017720 [Hyalomma asiaticum]
MACARGKYRAKILQEKADILREVDAGLLPKQEIAKKHGIPKTTLSTYIKNKRTIEDALQAEVASKRRRLRPAKYPDLEKALLILIKEMRSQDIRLSGPVILAKAADFALQLDYDDFAASDGWLHRFRERYDLVFRAVSGEMNAVNMETCEAPKLCKLTSHRCSNTASPTPWRTFWKTSALRTRSVWTQVQWCVVHSRMTTCQVRSAEPVAASDDDEEEDEAPVRPSAAEVMAGLNAARLFLSFEEGGEEAFRQIRSQSSGQAKPPKESVRCGVWRLCQRCQCTTCVSGVSQLLLRLGLVRLVLCALALLRVPWRAEMAPTPPVAVQSGVKKRGQRGSYKTLTMAKKAEIIRQVEGGRPEFEVAREFSISKQTVSDYLKQKAKILEAAEKASAGTQKNFRDGSHPSA